MDQVLEWGVDVVLWFQQASPQLDTFFAAFTFLGDEEFFLVLMPLVYWSIDRAVGVRLMVVFLLSGLVNQLVKTVAAQPRPFEYDPRVVQIVEQDGFGLPSGHTQSAVVVWGFLGSVVRKRMVLGGCGSDDRGGPDVADLSGRPLPDRCAGRVCAGCCDSLAVVAIRKAPGELVL